MQAHTSTQELVMDAFKTHGAFSWSELMTSNPGAATEFYGKLFNWTFDAMDMGTGTYHVAKLGETAIGGVSGSPPAEPKTPSAWGVYITVNNLDSTVRECQALGGTLCSGPFDVPGVGRMAVLQDPQGAVFNVMAYDEE
jgi:predicted enzyme related to lactoylglutathione lyase